MARGIDPAKTARKWGRVTPGRREDYQDGVANPRKSWHDATLEAGAAYRDGVQTAIAENRFERGVRQVSDEEYRRQTLEKGPQRWAQGVAGAQERYQRGFAPYAQALNEMTLPARGPKGDPRNLERVATVVQVLRDKKEELMGT